MDNIVVKDALTIILENQHSVIEIEEKCTAIANRGIEDASSLSRESFVVMLAYQKEQVRLMDENISLYPSAIANATMLMAMNNDSPEKRKYGYDAIREMFEAIKKDREDLLTIAIPTTEAAIAMYD